MEIKIVFILLLATLVSCSKPQPKNVIIDDRGKEHDLTLIADSIKYEVIVQVNDNDIWDSERLKGYKNHQQFIHSILKNIINGKLKAYDYATDEVLTAEEVKDIIENQQVDASQIGKLLFTEQWYIDTKGYLHKKIISITLGKAEYSQKGTFKGYSALFTVKY